MTNLFRPNATLTGDKSLTAKIKSNKQKGRRTADQFARSIGVPDALSAKSYDEGVANHNALHYVTYYIRIDCGEMRNIVLATRPGEMLKGAECSNMRKTFKIIIY